MEHLQNAGRKHNSQEGKSISLEWGKVKDKD